MYVCIYNYVYQLTQLANSALDIVEQNGFDAIMIWETPLTFMCTITLALESF